MIADEAVARTAGVFTVSRIGCPDSALEKTFADHPRAADPIGAVGKLQPVKKGFNQTHRGLLKDRIIVPIPATKKPGPHILGDISATRLSRGETL